MNNFETCGGRSAKRGGLVLMRSQKERRKKVKFSKEDIEEILNEVYEIGNGVCGIELISGDYIEDGFLNGEPMTRDEIAAALLKIEY